MFYTIRVLYKNTAVHEMILGINALPQTIDMLNSATMVEEYQIFTAGGIVRNYWTFGWEQKPKKWKIDGHIFMDSGVKV